MGANLRRTARSAAMLVEFLMCHRGRNQVQTGQHPHYDPKTYKMLAEIRIRLTRIKRAKFKYEQIRAQQVRKIMDLLAIRKE